MNKNYIVSIDNMLKEYSDKIVFEVIKICSEIHSFDANETFKLIKSRQDDNTLCNNNEDTPIKKKRGRPKKVKTDIVSNSYVTGNEDPVVKKLLNAMNITMKNDPKTKNKEEILTEGELTPDIIEDEDEEEIETTLFTHKGVEYLLAVDNTVYENIGNNQLVGKWDANNKTIISAT